MIRQSIDNLHDDITRVVVESQERGIYGKVLEVIDPSPGVWGGDPVEGLVTIVYECRCDYGQGFDPVHSHHALFGPTGGDELLEDVGWPADKPVDHYTLYAD